MVLSICLTPPHRVDFFCCSRQSSGQDGPSGDRSSHFYQGSARTCPVLHSCTAATLQKRYKKLKFISSYMGWHVSSQMNYLSVHCLIHVAQSMKQNTGYEEVTSSHNPEDALKVCIRPSGP